MSEPIVDLRGLLRGLHEHDVEYMLLRKRTPSSSAAPDQLSSAMPTRAFTAQFYERWIKLPGAERRAFRQARTRFFNHLVETGFHPPFPASLRIHRCKGPTPGR
jgi:hypothetical protein